jgi:pimeloyl-ACP methyl ester carboxylesterase
VSATIVLVHGAGNTAAVWQKVQPLLGFRSIAVNLPGRRDRVASIAEVTLEEAVLAVAADADPASNDPLIIVGHSAGGILVPGLAAQWGERVAELVFLAGLCAPHGETVDASVRPDGVAQLRSRLSDMRREYVNCMLDPDPGAIGMTAVDERTAMPIDSLNLMSQTVSWSGVPDVPRTFVRCLRDRVQTRQLQDKLISNCSASTVVDLDCGHTPALTAPADLADTLNALVRRRLQLTHSEKGLTS